MTEIPHEYRGWWRIIETPQLVNDDLDILGPALLSLTGYDDDRLRMHTLLACVNCPPRRACRSPGRERGSTTGCRVRAA